MVAIFNRKFLGLGLRCHDTGPSGTGILPGCRNDDRVFGFLLLGLVGLEHQLVLVGAAVVLVGCRRVDLTVTVPGHLHPDSNLALRKKVPGGRRRRVHSEFGLGVVIFFSQSFSGAPEELQVGNDSDRRRPNKLPSLSISLSLTLSF